MEIAPGILGIAAPWLVGLGLGVGILSGLLGVGGGILVTPALHILGMSMPEAVATSLTQMVGASLSGTFKHWRHQNVSLKLAMLYGCPGMLGVVAGKTLLSHWRGPETDKALSLLYMVMMAYLCGSFCLKAWQRTHPSKRPTVGSRWRYPGPHLLVGPGLASVAIIPSCLVGSAIGLLSSLTGLGGGFFYIPALMNLAGCSIKQAVGTSLACVFLSSIFGALVYGAAGLSDLRTALLLMLGSVLGAQLGASAAHRAGSHGLEGFFLLLTFSALLSMLLKQFSFDTAAYLTLFGGGFMIAVASLFMLIRNTSKKSPTSL